MKIRCSWVPLNDELYQKYHDDEWGIPEHNDNKLFEMLLLEGMQAGLSWATILKKRRNLRIAFDNFKANKIAHYNNNKINQLLKDKNIIRNKDKITAAINNAKIFLQIKKEYNYFDKYIWKFVQGTPIINSWNNIKDIPTSTTISDIMSKDLKDRGFKFVGPKICYAFMQAVGMVNDHTNDCYCYQEIKDKYSNH